MNIVILGAPGAGKGTQGSFLAADLGLTRVSTGDLLREILKDEGHPLYKTVEVIRSGVLLADEVVNQIVKSFVEDHREESFLFDGYPRTLAQAKALDEILAAVNKQVDAVLNLNVDREILLYRLLGRLTCRSCKHTVHESDGYKVCPKCGGELYTRADDNEVSVRARFAEYDEKTEPLIDYYQHSGVRYVDVAVTDRSAAATEVQQLVKKALEEALKQ